MIQCNRCNLQYIGEAKRRLKDRFNEHRRTIDNPNNKSFYVVSTSASIFFILYVKPIRLLLIQRSPAGSSRDLFCVRRFMGITQTAQRENSPQSKPNVPRTMHTRNRERSVWLTGSKKNNTLKQAQVILELKNEASSVKFWLTLCMPQLQNQADRNKK